jgi:hypothetical protein
MGRVIKYLLLIGFVVYLYFFNQWGVGFTNIEIGNIFRSDEAKRAAYLEFLDGCEKEDMNYYKQVQIDLANYDDIEVNRKLATCYDLNHKKYLIDEVFIALAKKQDEIVNKNLLNNPLPINREHGRFFISKYGDTKSKIALIKRKDLFTKDLKALMYSKDEEVLKALAKNTYHYDLMAKIQSHTNARWCKGDYCKEYNKFKAIDDLRIESLVTMLLFSNQSPELILHMIKRDYWNRIEDEFKSFVSKDRVIAYRELKKAGIVVKEYDEGEIRKLPDSLLKKLLLKSENIDTSSLIDIIPVIRPLRFFRDRNRDDKYIDRLTDDFHDLIDLKLKEKLSKLNNKKINELYYDLKDIYKPRFLRAIISKKTIYKKYLKELEALNKHDITRQLGDMPYISRKTMERLTQSVLNGSPIIKKQLLKREDLPWDLRKKIRQSKE